MTPVWVDKPAPKEEGRRKLDGIRKRTRLIIGGRDNVQNSGVDPKMRVMERFGELITAVLQNDLCCPLVVDRREICFCFHSKGDFIQSCMRSHAPRRGQDRNNLIRFISQC